MSVPLWQTPGSNKHIKGKKLEQESKIKQLKTGALIIQNMQI